MTWKTQDQATGADALRERVDYWLSRSHAADELQSYFRAVDGGESTYTGRWFDQLDGGGDRPPHHDHVTAADLVAVEMLSVRVPPETSAQLLHGRVGRQITDLLRQIPTGISLWQPEATQLITTGEAADRAWHLLTSQTGIGWVTAGKLLARKRPHLIPVFDEVVACALGAPSGFWQTLHHALTRTVGASQTPAQLVHRLRCEASVPEVVSDLRVLDVVIWMGHAPAHRRGECSHDMGANPSATNADLTVPKQA